MVVVVVEVVVVVVVEVIVIVEVVVVVEEVVVEVVVVGVWRMGRLAGEGVGLTAIDTSSGRCGQPLFFCVDCKYELEGVLTCCTGRKDPYILLNKLMLLFNIRVCCLNPWGKE